MRHSVQESLFVRDTRRGWRMCGRQEVKKAEGDGEIAAGERYVGLVFSSGESLKVEDLTRALFRFNA